MGVDISEFLVKEITSTYNDRAFASIGYILDEDRWVKKVDEFTLVIVDNMKALRETLAIQRDWTRHYKGDPN
ncbi:hypothetical protein HAX54_031082 [Datura stramonium]|uniref:Uncharacterized protein n=1 Tax=Datura stramonium TaxID=4076 RepID=A0ABS8VBQ9_DATST|nr:hypothetical protein [Datura stramonium]